jgi:hypothetical protein
MDGVIGVDDEFELEAGFFFGDRRHIFQTIPTQINSPKNASSKPIVTIWVTRKAHSVGQKRNNFIASKGQNHDNMQRH